MKKMAILLLCLGLSGACDGGTTPGENTPPYAASSSDLSTARQANADRPILVLPGSVEKLSGGGASFGTASPNENLSRLCKQRCPDGWIQSTGDIGVVCPPNEVLVEINEGPFQGCSICLTQPNCNHPQAAGPSPAID